MILWVDNGIRDPLPADYIISVEPAYTITSTAKDSIVIEQDANILKFINEIKGLFILNL